MTLETVLFQYLADSTERNFGAAAAIWVDGVPVDAASCGWASSFELSAGELRLLPESTRIPVTEATRFDIASLSKLFTATIAMSLVSDGILDLDAPVYELLPEFGEGLRRSVTLRHLLTHTAGLREDEPLWALEFDSRLTHVLSLPLRAAPGATFSYSCVGYIAAGVLLQRATGLTLPELLEERIATPLGLSSTGYSASGAPLTGVAATEFEPWAGRGVVSGEVHDEMAWALGGAAGNAGVFSTLGDLMIFGEAFRTGGRSLLSDEAFREMTSPQPPHDAPGFQQAVGFRIDAPDFMGELAGPFAIGHTGFAGTSIVIDRDRGITAVLLSNRVHPTREGTDIASLRRAVAGEALLAKDAAAVT